MALIADINGVGRGIRNLSISATQNGVDSLSCELDSTDGLLTVDIDDPIEIIEDGTYLFGGSVKRPKIVGKGDSIIAITNKINAQDNNEIAERDIILGMVIPAGSTTREALQEIIDGGYLPGVTNGMPNSPDTSPVIAEELVYDEVYVKTALEDIGIRSGWLYEIDYTKVASYFAPGSRSAPWNVIDGDGNAIAGITVETSRLEYFNRWVIKFAERARAAYAFLEMSGNFSEDDEVEIGGRTYVAKNSPSAEDEFQIGADVTASLNALISAIVSGVGGSTIHPTVGAYLQNSSTMAARALTAGASGNAIDVDTTSSNGVWITEGSIPTPTLTFGFDEGLANRTTVENESEVATYGAYTNIAEAPTVFTLESAQALGAMLLAQSIVVVKTVTYDTFRGGLLPGMTQTIQAANRFLNNSCLITEVNTRMLEGSKLRRTITAMFNVVSGSGDTFRSTPWRDQYRKWSGKTGATTVSGSVGGGGGGTTGLGIYFPLQTSQNVSVQGTAGAWYPADGAPAGESGIQIYLDPAELGTNVGTVYLRVKAASGTVTARLRNANNTYTAGAGSPVSGSMYQYYSFAITFVADWYLLELSPSVSGLPGRVNATGYVKC